MAERTESFNEANVSKDFKDIMAQAEVIKNILSRGDQELTGTIGNGSMDDAYSGAAAAKIREQWGGLASTFDNFLTNFQNWYNQGVDAARKNQNLQAETANVTDADEAA